MDERGSLESVVGPLGKELAAGERPQLFVDDGEEPVDGHGFPRIHPSQEDRGLIAEPRAG